MLSCDLWGGKKGQCRPYFFTTVIRWHTARLTVLQFDMTTCADLLSDGAGEEPAVGPRAAAAGGRREDESEAVGRLWLRWRGRRQGPGYRVSSGPGRLLGAEAEELPASSEGHRSVWTKITKSLTCGVNLNIHNIKIVCFLCSNH